MNDRKIQKQFLKLPQEPQVQQYQVEERTINYVEVGKPDQRMVLFVHGAPGSSSNFLRFLQDTVLAAQARLISVDRPGYGFSGFGKSEISIQKQAAMIKPILEKNQHPKAPILVGHSYGGPVIAQIAMDYPDLVGALVMVAPAIDPENEKVFWFNKPANWALFRWMLPRTMKVANDEKLSHQAELEKMKPHWDKIKVPTTFIHGEKDGLVPMENSKFGEKMLTNAPVDTIYRVKMNHLIPWNQPELIKETVLKYLNHP